MAVKTRIPMEKIMAVKKKLQKLPQKETGKTRECQCALQRDPPCARKSDPPLGVMCKDTKWGFNEGGKRGVA